jgi:hypothetical protein
VKTRDNLAESCTEGYGSERALLPMMMMTRHYIPENKFLDNHRIENMESFFFIWFVRLLARGHSWPIVPASGDSEDDCGEADGMYIGRGNLSSLRKPTPAPLLSITKSHMTRPGFEPGPPRWEHGILYEYLCLYFLSGLVFPSLYVYHDIAQPRGEIIRQYESLS